MTNKFKPQLGQSLPLIFLRILKDLYFAIWKEIYFLRVSQDLKRDTQFFKTKTDPVISTQKSGNFLPKNGYLVKTCLS